MDTLFSFLVYFVLFFVPLAIILLASTLKSSGKLPPGRTGWPVIGETLEFAFRAKTGKLERFTEDRMKKFSPEVFRTSLIGEDMAVMCGALGNKFVFSNEDKLVASWWPSMIKKIMFSPSLFANPSERKTLMRSNSYIHEFLKPEEVKQYVEIMDVTARKLIDEYCTSKEEVVEVYPLSKKYAFDLSCRLFMNVEDPEFVAKICHDFDRIMEGLISLPVDVPGTRFNHAIKARSTLHDEIVEIIRKRKKEFKENGESAAAYDDLLSVMLLKSDESIEQIITRINGMVLASHETSSSALTFVIKCLAQYPHVYDAVFEEMMEIAKTKGPDEILNWSDVQKMKYSWNVARESMRLLPPAFGGFREALTDFTYAGFTIPKGWKIHWTAHSTHKNPKYFPDPEKFDPSRFEGKGPQPYTFVPFGGGPSMCPGKEYARVQILVFMYNVVTRFKLELVNPNEKVTYNATPTPENGLPIRFHPHQM